VSAWSTRPIIVPLSTEQLGFEGFEGGRLQPPPPPGLGVGVGFGAGVGFGFGAGAGAGEGVGEALGRITGIDRGGMLGVAVGSVGIRSSMAWQPRASAPAAMRSKSGVRTCAIVGLPDLEAT